MIMEKKYCQAIKKIKRHDKQILDNHITERECHTKNELTFITLVKYRINSKTPQQTFLLSEFYALDWYPSYIEKKRQPPNPCQEKCQAVRNLEYQNITTLYKSPKSHSSYKWP